MKLFHREFGSGKPFVILHGLLGLSDNWVPLAKQISGHGFRVIIPDLRNHGQSFHNNRFDYPAMVEDLLHLFNDLQITNAIVCGHSMGGKVAMNLALSYPNMIEKLLVIDMGVKEYPIHHNELLEAMLSFDFTQVSSRKEIEEKLNKQIKDSSVRQLLLKNIAYRNNTFEWKPNLSSIRENLKNIFCGISVEKTLEKPALFIRGENSDYVKDEDLQGIRNIFPNAAFITIPKAGHWIHVDNPEVFINEVLEFLKN